MADPFIGQIILFAGNYAPEGWALCNGQILQVQQYQALFAILTDLYGGDGRTTFGLPDLRGAAPVGFDPASAPYALGKKGGATAVTLTSANLPAHNHTLNVASATGSASSTSPQNNYLANSDDGTGSGTAIPLYGASTNATANLGAIGNTGGNQSISTQSPYVAMNYIIALTGIWPQRP